MRRFILAAIICTMVVGFTATGAMAAGNPAVHGQPSQSCGSETAEMEPNGFGTEGFTHAAEVYAGSEETPSLENGNSRAVSQYDVACFQISSNHAG